MHSYGNNDVSSNVGVGHNIKTWVQGTVTNPPISNMVISKLIYVGYIVTIL